MMKLKSLLWFCFLFLVSCNNLQKDAENREKFFKSGAKKVKVGVIWPFSKDKGMFKEGVLTAKHIIDSSDDFPFEIKLVFADDHSSSKKGQRIARKFANDEEMIAVIGHYNSGVALPASIIYDASNLLYINPGATNPSLNRHGFKNMIRTISNDTQIGKSMAIFTAMQNFKKPIILHERNDYAKSLANIYQSELVKYNIDIASKVSFDSKTTDFRLLISELKNKEGDIYVYCGGLPGGGYFVNQLRGFGITQTVLGADGFDNKKLLEIVGDKVENIIFPSHYNPETNSQLNKSFKETFRELYDKEPDTWAAQGFDAFHLLANAMFLSESINPYMITGAFRYLENWEGVAGNFYFDKQGESVAKEMYLKQIQDNRFVVVDTLEIYK